MNTGFGAGKELRETQKSCVSWYDYGARMYDAALGRWHTVDPMTDKHPDYTPYAYFYNNPVLLIDPNVMDTLSIMGANGNSFSFIHDNFEKRSINVPFDIGSSNSINFNEMADGAAPDVIGYSVGLSATGNALMLGGKADAVINYAIFTSGDYAWQPFKYGDVGAQGGAAACTDLFAGDVSASLSAFAAWGVGGIKNTPGNWAGGFTDITLNGSGGEGIIGGGTLGYFESTSLTTGSSTAGYRGFSLGISIGLGVKAGAPASATLLGGASYYQPLEFHPTTTNRLMNSGVGMTRMAAKWADFATMGIIPGTHISDGLHYFQK